MMHNADVITRFAMFRKGLASSSYASKRIEIDLNNSRFPFFAVLPLFGGVLIDLRKQPQNCCGLFMVALRLAFSRPHEALDAIPNSAIRARRTRAQQIRARAN